MKYIDLHCDTLTECVKRDKNIFENDLHIDIKRLKKSGAAAQCFAVFSEGDGAEELYNLSRNYFLNATSKSVDFVAADSAEKIENCVKSGIVGGVFCVESLSFLKGRVEKISELKRAGVKICSLVWNYKNELATPNLRFSGGVPNLKSRSDEPLTERGVKAVELMDECGIIPDISHLSDGGARQILKGRKMPAVATHSNAAEVLNVSRNLTDELIRLIADCGGVIGLNFCRAFLGEGDSFERVLAHARHVEKIGGSGVLALGSDFDGIPTIEGLEGCQKMPALLEYLTKNLGSSVTESLAYKNALRVLKR